ncbi:MAG TPA: hypothetical protein ENG87_01170 [Candidatus Pacearchaeota archaeon]|nr:hypothetical protein [Candidatus Pacearchaeota archaeon]
MEYIKCKYQLYKDEIFFTTILPPTIVNTKYIHMSLKGVMTMKKGWAWDGCSGPTIDESWNQRSGCGHDGLYWLVRNGYLSKYSKPVIDRCFYKWLREDIEIIIDRMLKRLEIDKKEKSKYSIFNFTKKYMSYPIKKSMIKINKNLLLKRAKYYYWAVKKFGDPSIDPKNKRQKIIAP